MEHVTYVQPSTSYYPQPIPVYQPQAPLYYSNNNPTLPMQFPFNGVRPNNPNQDGCFLNNVPNQHEPFAQNINGLHSNPLLSPISPCSVYGAPSIQIIHPSIEWRTRKIHEIERLYEIDFLRDGEKPYDINFGQNRTIQSNEGPIRVDGKHSRIKKIIGKGSTRGKVERAIQTSALLWRWIWIK